MNFRSDAIISVSLGTDFEWRGLFRMKYVNTGFTVYGHLVNGQSVVLEKLPYDLDQANRALADWSDIYDLDSTETA